MPLFAWTPLITSGMFDGIMTDVQTTVAAIVSILVVIVGLTMIVKAFR